MIIKKICLKLKSLFVTIPYKFFDSIYVRLDRQNIRRSRNITLIPNEKYRKGGKYSYAEWAHVIGIFQTLINQNLKNKENANILDVGCGTGLLAIASEPFLSSNSKYVGIDVVPIDIEFCRNHYDHSKFSFDLLSVLNPAYNPKGCDKKEKWDLADNVFDLVTALSVWTHFDEEDAKFYLKEVYRVLKPGGRAIITFFYLNDLYNRKLSLENKNISDFHMTPVGKWIFNVAVKDSKEWLTPEWVNVPENAIGITEKGLDIMTKESGLNVISIHNGNWKEIPGMFFQDIIIFEKPNSRETLSIN